MGPLFVLLFLDLLAVYPISYCIADHHLSIDDLCTVFTELFSARSKWHCIGIQLKMNCHDLDAIKARNKEDPDDCLKDLLSCWLRQIKSKPTWSAVVSALKSDIIRYEQLAEDIRKRYCALPPKIEACSSTNCKKAVDTQQSDAHDSESNEEYFHCPCGQCDVISYLDKGCPKTNSKQYPYLEMSELSDDDKEDLVQKLSDDTANIIQCFADLLSTTSESLNKRNVKVDKLIKVALDLGAYKSDNNQIPLLEEDRDELRKAGSVDTAFIVLGKHLSFFNYEILSHIIKHLGSKDDLANLTEYCSQFKTFCDRKVVEVSPSVFDPSGQKRRNRKLFVVLCTGNLIRHFNDVKGAQRKIASLLGLRVSTLQLKQVDLSSIILVFSIPASVEGLFPLNSTVDQNFKSNGYTVISPSYQKDQLLYATVSVYILAQLV